MAKSARGKRASERKRAAKTGPVKENTPQAEAARRKAEGVSAPTAEEVGEVENPAEAQTLADTAALMGPNSDNPGVNAAAAAPPPGDTRPAGRRADRRVQRDKPRTQEEFDKEHNFVSGNREGMTEQDRQNAQNAEVARLTTGDPTQETIDQRNAAMENLPTGEPRRRGGPPPRDRALSLEEMGKAKLYGSAPA